MDVERRFPKYAVWRYLRFLIGIALGAFVLYVLNGQRNDLVIAARQLDNLRVEWVAIAAVVEVISYVCLGRLQRQLLRAGDVCIGTVYATELSFAQSAISSSLPGGPAFSSIYLYREYRRKGATSVLSVWVLAGTLICEALTLSLVATAGVGMAIQEGASYDLIIVTLATLAIFAGLDAVIWQRRWLIRIGHRLLLWSQRHCGRPRRDIAAAVDAVIEQLAKVHLSRRDFGRSVLFGMGFWVFDCAALVASFAAVGAPVPWRGLLLAYGAGQLAANLPITPGGLGVVEGSLTVALVVFGGAELPAISAVLLYRIVSFWGPLVVGWISWSGLTLRRSAELRRRLEVAGQRTEREFSRWSVYGALRALGRSR